MLDDHIEEFLGPIKKRYEKSISGEKLPFQVVHCPRGIEGLHTYSTLGLSNYPLECRGRHIQQELMISVLNQFAGLNIAGLLQQLAIRALERQAAFAPGDVIASPHQLFDGKPFCSIYTTKPGFMPEEFINYSTGDGDKITFSILLPITPAEEKYITLHGYERFDLQFIGSGADMLDLDRNSIV
jgi:hypothetical protein